MGKTDKSMAISLGVTPERFAKGDIIVNAAVEKKQRRASAVFSPACKRWLDSGKISRPAYDMAEVIHNALNGLEGCQIGSRMDPNVIAAMVGKGSKKMPTGFMDWQIDMAAQLRHWANEAGSYWLALAVVCCGFSVREGARLMGKRESNVTQAIRELLEKLASQKDFMRKAGD